MAAQLRFEIEDFEAQQFTWTVNGDEIVIDFEGETFTLQQQRGGDRSYSQTNAVRNRRVLTVLNLRLMCSYGQPHDVGTVNLVISTADYGLIHGLVNALENNGYNSE